MLKCSPTAVLLPDQSHLDIMLCPEGGKLALHMTSTGRFMWAAGADGASGYWAWGWLEELVAISIFAIC